MTPTTPSNDLPHRPVIDGLTAVANVLLDITARSLDQAECSVTVHQFQAMTLLAAAPRRVTDLATALGIQSSTATRMCDRLVRKQLMRREERSDDRRASWATLTPAGHDFIDTALRHRHEAITALVEAVADRLTPQLPVLLHAIAAAGGHPIHPPAPNVDPLDRALARTLAGKGTRP